MKKSKIDREQQAVTACRELLTHPLQQKIMGIMAAASDNELSDLGTKAGAVLEVLVRWGKRAVMGLSSAEDLKRWFLSDDVPDPVKKFLVHAVGLLNR